MQHFLGLVIPSLTMLEAERLMMHEFTQTQLLMISVSVV